MSEQSEHVDIAIIGAGPGGDSTALRAAELGKTVALIDRDDSLGGTCLNRGCIPSKALITATRAISGIRHAERMGIHASIESIDFRALRDYKQSMVRHMTQGLAGLLAQRGVTVYQGEAAVRPGSSISIAPSPGQAAVRRSQRSGKTSRSGNGDGGSREDLGHEALLQADDIVIATGAEPQPLAGIEFGQSVIDSTGALALEKFPANAVVVGAGAVAVEFASMWAQTGSKVTLLIRKDRVLSSWDRRTGTTLTRELKSMGVSVLSHTGVDQIESGDDGGVTVHYHVNDDHTTAGEPEHDGHDHDGPARGSDKSNATDQRNDDEDRTVQADLALIAIGRAPNTASSWLEDIGVEKDQRGYINTDAWGRTSAEHIWAVGDITHGAALAHRAFEQGIVIAESIAGLNPAPVDDASVPEVVFSTPEAASVGLTSQQAQERDDLINVKQTPYPMLSNARMLMDDARGSLSIITGEERDHPGTPVVLGVQIVAPDASAIIAEAQQLVGNRIPLHAASGLVHPHPTLSETLGEALLKADGRPLHMR